MIEIALKSTLLLALAGFAARYLRQRPAALHMVWLAALLGVVVLPLVSLGFGKGLTLLIPQARPMVYGLDPDLPESDYANQKTSNNPGSQSPVAGRPSSRSLPAEIPWDQVALGVWFAGFAVLALRTGAGLVSIAALRRFGSRPVDFEDLSVHPRDLAARAGLKPNWELRQSTSPEPATAMTWGVIRPVVLLPQDAGTWSPQRLEAVLLHEFAHVRRLDFASQLLAELACALYWFNPLAWLGARAMRSGAESAADDAVLRSGVKATEYATELLQIAADLGRRSQTLSRIGVSAMTQPKIESRLQSVLSPSARNRGLTSVQLLAALAATAFAVTALGALHVAAKPIEGARSQAESKEALARMKQLTLATFMYSEDFDGVFPYVQGTDSASIGTIRALVAPYAKDQTVFFSPTKGGMFHYNMNIAGVHINSIDAPAEVPMFIETLGDKVSMRAAGFIDGHAKMVQPGDKDVAKQLARKFPRTNGSKPLPPGYLGGGLTPPPLTNGGNVPPRNNR